MVKTNLQFGNYQLDLITGIFRLNDCGCHCDPLPPASTSDRILRGGFNSTVVQSNRDSVSGVIYGAGGESSKSFIGSWRTCRRCFLINPSTAAAAEAQEEESAEVSDSILIAVLSRHSHDATTTTTNLL